ncbi:MAG: AraC family transcriptional regulator [bacterium]
MLALGNILLQIYDAKWAELTPESWQRQYMGDVFWRFYQHNGNGAYVRSSDVTLEMTTGRIYLIPAGVRFDYWTSQKCGQFYVHFDLPGISRPVYSELCDRPVAVRNDHELQHNAAKFGRYIQNGGIMTSSRECQLKSVLYGALAHYFDDIPEERFTRALHRATFMQPIGPAIKYIEENYSRQITITELAEICCLSPQHFVRKFGQATGITPIQHLHTQRVGAAAKLLLSTDITIDEIALRVGFHTREYLTRIFTRHTSMSPAAYRNTMKAKLK